MRSIPINTFHDLIYNKRKKKSSAGEEGISRCIKSTAGFPRPFFKNPRKNIEQNENMDKEKKNKKKLLLTTRTQCTFMNDTPFETGWTLAIRYKVFLMNDRFFILISETVYFFFCAPVIVDGALRLRDFDSDIQIFNPK